MRRISASSSWMSSPDTSIVTEWTVPVKANGGSYSGHTGAPGAAPTWIPDVSPSASGVVTGTAAWPTSSPSR